jgi:tungstate transport system ATP-binding protein
MTNETVILEARNLLVLRGKREVLNIERFSLGKNEVVALVGANGAGKSTLLQALALLLHPAQGVVEFYGQKADNSNVLAFRRRMAFVFQEPLLLNTTVFDNVAAGLKIRGFPRREIPHRVGYWLEQLGISSLAGRHAHLLSGGEARRVSLARAFALEPEVLFLDEPFSALDFLTRIGLLEKLGELLSATGISAVFVTHDFFEVPFLTDRITVLKQGRLVKTGSFEEVFKIKPRRETFATSLYRIFQSE